MENETKTHFIEKIKKQSENNLYRHEENLRKQLRESLSIRLCPYTDRRMPDKIMDCLDEYLKETRKEALEAEEVKLTEQMFTKLQAIEYLFQNR